MPEHIKVEVSDPTHPAAGLDPKEKENGDMESSPSNHSETTSVTKRARSSNKLPGTQSRTEEWCSTGNLLPKGAIDGINSVNELLQRRQKPETLQKISSKTATLKKQFNPEETDEAIANLMATILHNDKKVGFDDVCSAIENLHQLQENATAENLIKLIRNLAPHKHPAANNINKLVDLLQREKSKNPSTSLDELTDLLINQDENRAIHDSLTTEKNQGNWQSTIIDNDSSSDDDNGADSEHGAATEKNAAVLFNENSAKASDDKQEQYIPLISFGKGFKEEEKDEAETTPLIDRVEQLQTKNNSTFTTNHQKSQDQKRAIYPKTQYSRRNRKSNSADFAHYTLLNDDGKGNASKFNNTRDVRFFNANDYFPEGEAYLKFIHNGADEKDYQQYRVTTQYDKGNDKVNPFLTKAEQGRISRQIHTVSGKAANDINYISEMAYNILRAHNYNLQNKAINITYSVDINLESRIWLVTILERIGKAKLGNINLNGNRALDLYNDYKDRENFDSNCQYAIEEYNYTSDDLSIKYDKDKTCSYPPITEIKPLITALASHNNSIFSNLTTNTTRCGSQANNAEATTSYTSTINQQQAMCG